jgi:hypothetical protein
VVSREEVETGFALPLIVTARGGAFMGEWKPPEKIVHERVRDDPMTAHFIHQCSGVSVKYTDTGIPSIPLSAFSRRQSFCAGIVFQ